jgi:hypothetical protein
VRPCSQFVAASVRRPVQRSSPTDELEETPPATAENHVLTCAYPVPGEVLITGGEPLPLPFKRYGTPRFPGYSRGERSWGIKPRPVVTVRTSAVCCAQSGHQRLEIE